jgi:hypothetical protein
LIFFEKKKIIKTFYFNRFILISIKVGGKEMLEVIDKDWLGEK